MDTVAFIERYRRCAICECSDGFYWQRPSDTFDTLAQCRADIDYRLDKLTPDDSPSLVPFFEMYPQ